MSLREEQCKKVCRILDDVLANRPTERDSLIVAVRKAFESLEQFGNSEPLPSAQPKSGKWIDAVIPNDNGGLLVQVCDQCNTFFPLAYTGGGHHFCPNCGADMRGEQDE